MPKRLEELLFSLSALDKLCHHSLLIFSGTIVFTQILSLLINLSQITTDINTRNQNWSKVCFFHSGLCCKDTRHLSLSSGGCWDPIVLYRDEDNIFRGVFLEEGVWALPWEENQMVFQHQKKEMWEVYIWRMQRKFKQICHCRKVQTYMHDKCPQR